MNTNVYSILQYIWCCARFPEKYTRVISLGCVLCFNMMEICTFCYQKRYFFFLQFLARCIKLFNFLLLPQKIKYLHEYSFLHVYGIRLNQQIPCLNNVLMQTGINSDIINTYMNSIWIYYACNLIKINILRKNTPFGVTSEFIF